LENFRFKEHFSSPLLLAAIAFGKTDIAKYLLEQGAPVRGSDNRSTSAAHLCVENNNVEVLEILLQKGTCT
jgi:ankyrin repeat protein